MKSTVTKILRFGAQEKIVVSGPLFLANQKGTQIIELSIIGDAIST